MIDFAERLIAKAMSDTEFFGPDGPCPARHEPGRPGSRVLVITGENAGGKSFFAKYLRAVLAGDKETFGRIEIMDGGMHRRTRSGVERAFMFGDEDAESTGNISLKFVLTGIRTCRKRTTPHVLSLDEPDVGLSESYARALGELLTAFGGELPEHTRALIVITHSRTIVEHLMAIEPHLVRVGPDRRSTRDWLAQGPERRSIEDLENLHIVAVERMRAIQKVIDRRKAERQATR